MKPEFISHPRFTGFAQSRSLTDDNDVAIDISTWDGVWEANYIQQLHGRSDVAVSVVTNTTGNTSDASVPFAVLQAVEAAQVLWYHRITPQGGGDPVLLGWGLLELTP